jgi:hypothetical protein
VQQLGAIGGFHSWAGWVEEWMAMLRKNGSKLLIGYLGDALSGKHLVRPSLDTGKWLENWEVWSLEEGWAGSSLLRPETATLMTHCVRDRLEDMSRQANYAFPHQVAMHLDWYGRQRRFVASQANTIVRFLSPVLYFYTYCGMQFWSNVGMDDVEDQRLYLSYAVNRFPNLFHEPKVATLPERFWGAGKNLLIGLLPSMKEFVAPRELDIHFLITQHQNHFVSLVEEISPIVEDIVDTQNLLKEIKAFPNNFHMTAQQLLRFVNLSILLKLGLGRGELHFSRSSV